MNEKAKRKRDADPFEARRKAIEQVNDGRERGKLYGLLNNDILRAMNAIKPPELKPCPFCGGEAVLKGTQAAYQSVAAHVKCPDCLCSTPLICWGPRMLGDFYTVEDCVKEAADRWNRRADDE